jgi:hypothetical protein
MIGGWGPSLRRGNPRRFFGSQLSLPTNAGQRHRQARADFLKPSAPSAQRMMRFRAVRAVAKADTQTTNSANRSPVALSSEML